MRLVRKKKTRAGAAAAASKDDDGASKINDVLESRFRCLLVAIGLGGVFLVKANQALCAALYGNGANGHNNKTDGIITDSISGCNCTLPINPEEECFPLGNYSKKVTRVDIRKFIEEGPGKQYMPLFGYMRNHSIHVDGYYDTIGQIFNFHPDIYLLRPAHYPTDKFFECRLLFQHNYKVGGNTVHLSKIPQNGIPVDYLPHVKRSQQLSADELFEFNKKIPVSARPGHGLPKSRITAFTFIRDPVPRFVSALAQCIKMGHIHSLCHPDIFPVPKGTYPVQLLESGDMHPTDFIQCVLDTMEHDISYLDMHFLPQAFMIYNQHRGRNVDIDLMAKSDIYPVLRGMGMPDTVDKVQNKMNTTTGMPLANGTALLTEQQIHTICRLYRLDIDLLHLTGVTTTRCDDAPFNAYTERWLPEKALTFFSKLMWSLPDPTDLIGTPPDKKKKKQQ